ncbi:hypothetical protein [Hyalangium sp.]|uniref:hypothetical protein n=1 Tax=Hyalangium sp. TaxID=2028555 RepID=UPI002D3EE340|nr:hypothetical protein [Hyalangium sp.]HYH95697.1 hypothetical protein [Hyalangium sp.]
MLVAGLLALGVLPLPAHAQGKFERHLTAAVRLYQSLEYERALTQIELARKLPHSSEQEVELSLYEGIILAESGKQESSAAAFKSALLVQPEAVLPVKVSPKVKSLFESVREQVQRELAALAPKPEPPKVEPAPPPPPAPTVVAPPAAVASQSSLRTSLRSAAPIMAIAGGSLVVAGGISWAISRGELNRLRSDDIALNSREAVNQTVSKGRTWQTAGVTLLGVGTAGLITAAGGFLLGTSAEPVAVGLGTDGTSAFVFGRWP